MTHIPYRGGLQTVQAILTNDVHMVIEGIFSLPPFLADGKVRALAVTTSTRSHVLPDVPAIAETVPGFDAGAWIILFAPTGTPAPIVERLSEEVNRSRAASGTRPARREGATVFGTTREAAAAFHRQELEKFRQGGRASRNFKLSKSLFCRAKPAERTRCSVTSSIRTYSSRSNLLGDGSKIGLSTRRSQRTSWSSRARMSGRCSTWPTVRGGAAAIVTEPLGIAQHQAKTRLRVYGDELNGGLRTTVGRCR